MSITDKCLRTAKIEGKIKLDIGLSGFVSVSNAIRASILRCLGSEYANDTKNYIILKLE